MNRRPMSAALQTGSLSDAAKQFLNAGSPRPTTESAAPDLPPAPATPTQHQAVPASDLPLDIRVGDGPVDGADTGLAALTVRVPRTVPPTLLLASMNRKLQRKRPWTQQDIVAEALTAWLKQHGYLT